MNIEKQKYFKKIKNCLIVVSVLVILTALLGVDAMNRLVLVMLLIDLVGIIYKHSIKNFNNGYEFHIREKYDLALDYYNKAIKLNPFFAAAFNNRGLVLVKKQKYDLAFNDFDKAIKLKPHYVVAYFNRGCAHAEKQEYELAITDFIAAIKIDPAYAHAYFELGHAYEVQNFKQSAIEIYYALIKKIPVDKESVEKAKEKIRNLECKM